MQNFYRISRLTLLAIFCFSISSTLKAQVILTDAGNGTYGYSGDGSAATASEVETPYSVVVDKAGNIYIADYGVDVIRKVTVSTGIITTLAGSGTGGYSDGLGTAAQFNGMEGLAIDTSTGNLYVADANNQRIRMVTPGGVVTTIAGTGTAGFFGDGAPASGCQLNYPSGVAVDKSGNIYIADNANNRIREITGSTINTIVGNGTAGFAGDGAAATLAELNAPSCIAVDKAGNIYIADASNQRIRKVNAITQTISTIAGNGNTGYIGTNIPATNAQLYNPWGIAVDASGNVYFADQSNNMIEEVFASNDSITLLAGFGQYSYGYNGDHIPGINAELYTPLGLAIDDSSNIYFADENNYRVRELKVTGPNIVVEPQSNDNVCPGAPTYVSIVTSGTGVTYQWLVDSNYSNWDTVKNGAVYSGATSDTLKFNVGTQQGNSYQYMCVINNGYETSTVGNVYINYLPNVNLGYPTDSICPGTPTQISAWIGGGSRIKPLHHPAVPASGILWSTGDSTDTITVMPLVTTKYTVTATQSGCSVTDTITVDVDRTKVSVKAFPSTSVCSGNTVTLFGQGVSSYSWSSGINNGVGFTPPGTSTYTVTGVDDIGCLIKDSVTITVNPLPVVTITSTSATDTICQGTSLTLSGGGAVSYNWSGGVVNNTAFTPSSSEVYYLTGTDANGCSGTTSIPITVAPLPVITGTASPSTVCAGGSVTLTGNGGSSYVWSGGVTNGVAFTPVTSGTYTVTGTDAAGCTGSGQVIITVSPKPIITANAFPSATLCEGSSVALFGGGGVSYAWSGSVNNGVSFNPTSSGTYTVTGVDVNGCFNKDSIMITVNKKVVITPVTSNTSCGLKNGSASVIASNGLPPYTYLWSTTPASTSSSVDSLGAGTYVVTVSDSAKCPSTLVIGIGASTAPILSVTTTPSNCGTVGTGSASVSVTGGTAPYKLMWNNGDTLANDYNLKAATYIITVTDVNGCSTFAPGIVTNANGPKISISSQSNVKCYGSTSGALSVSVSGGVSPYTYLWSNGATTSAIGALQAGPYQLVVMDADSCTSVMSFNITQPAALTLTSSIVKSDCGVSDGAASVAVSGGTSPFTYAWNNGATTSSNASVMAGVYEATVTDGNGCIDSVAVAVSDKTGPTVSLDVTANAGCGSGGSIVTSATGGTSPYTYTWSDGLTTTSISNVPAGNYFVTVTDHLGCVGSADTIITETVPAVLPLCLVTVDSASSHNLVIWDKTAATNIDHYNVYKESTTAGVYFLVSSVPYTSPATYVDSLSNPMVRSWRYKISQVDTCGNESPLSPDHKTMHLTVNEGVGNVINLIWDNYEGLTFYTYYVYRDTLPFTYTKIDSIPNNIFTYTDLHPLVTNKTALYHIGIDNPGSCTPLRTLAINYNSSKSNSGNIVFVPTGIATVSDLNNCSVYPNPSNGRVTVSMNLSQNTQSLSLKVINTLGQEVYAQSYSRIGGQFTKELDLSDLAKGVYFLKLSDNQSTVYKKIVLQ